MSKPYQLPQDIKQFWSQQAQQLLTWHKPWQEVYQGNFYEGDNQWFVGGQLNVSYNCLDKHLAILGDKPALIWVGDEVGKQQTYTFAALHEAVCLMANALKKLGIQKGDTVGIYLPMIPEAVIAMLACARIGAIHTVIFAGFSIQSLQQRLEQAACHVLITADGYQRGGKTYYLKEKAEEVLNHLAIKTLVIDHLQSPLHLNQERDYLWSALKKQVEVDCSPEIMDSEDPLFILYTSGSTGKPKGVVHTTAGYLLQTTYSFQHIFQYQKGEVFWCTADIGWITGHSYVVYGPLCSGATLLIHEGIPNWPDPSRCWQIIDEHQVNIFYTAPTAIRSLKRAGDEWLQSSTRKSLRMLGSVGEPINPEVWEWYKIQVGQGCLIINLPSAGAESSLFSSSNNTG